MSKLRMFVVIIIGITLFGCSSASFIKNGDKISPAMGKEIHQWEVRVYTAFPEGIKYENLGIAAVKMLGGGMISDNYPEAVEKAKEIARQNGGNAIVIENTGEGTLFTGFGPSQQSVRVNATVLYIYPAE